jgi:hypothetical protein
MSYSVSVGCSCLSLHSVFLLARFLLSLYPCLFCCRRVSCWRLSMSVRCSLAPVSLSLAPFSLQTEARLHRSHSLSLPASLLLACAWLASLCILSMKSSLGEYCVDLSLQATRLSLAAGVYVDGVAYPLLLSSRIAHRSPFSLSSPATVIRRINASPPTWTHALSRSRVCVTLYGMRSGVKEEEDERRKREREAVQRRHAGVLGMAALIGTCLTSPLVSMPSSLSPITSLAQASLLHTQQRHHIHIHMYRYINSVALITSVSSIAGVMESAVV